MASQREHSLLLAISELWTVDRTCSVLLVADIFRGDLDQIDPDVSAVLDIPLSTLSPRERDVLILEYGLETGQPMTLKQVGQSLTPNVTREWVRRLRDRALRKMRHPSRSGHLRSYVASGVVARHPSRISPYWRYAGMNRPQGPAKADLAPT